jgi:hypothetical protein
MVSVEIQFYWNGKVQILKLTKKNIPLTIAIKHY